MPRTKAHKDTLKAKEIKILADFKRKSAVELKKLESDLEMKMMQVLDNMDVQFHQFPVEIQSMTLGELFQRIEAQSDDEDSSRDSSSFNDRLRRHTNVTSDDGYSTDKPQLYKSKLMSSSKSSERSKIVSLLKHTSKKKRSMVYAHTPANRRPVTVEPITPKVCPNVAVNLLRKPRNGETVISMNGSPLMVTTSVLQEDHMANLLVPLNNGDVLSLLPTGDLQQSLLPTISPRTREQLRKLKNHIEKFIS